jgi:hypothetical protein
VAEIKGTADGRTPGYYQGQGKLQPFDIIDAYRLGFYDGNFCKYLIRWKLKNGLEDLAKATHYLDELIKRAGSEHRPEGWERPDRLPLDVISGAFGLGRWETNALGYVLRWRWDQDQRWLDEAKRCMTTVTDQAIARQQREIADEVAARE